MAPDDAGERVRAEVERKRAELMGLEKQYETAIKTGGFLQRLRYQMKLDELRDSPDYQIYVSSARNSAKNNRQRGLVTVRE